MATEPTRVLLATRSSDKAREIREILGPSGLRIVSLEEIGIEASPEEQGIEAFDTFLANAEAKARYFHHRSGMPVIADDSGLCVDALAGGPGVRSKRFSGRVDLDGEQLDLANNNTLLQRLDGIATAQRGARYLCAAVLVRSDAPITAALGTVRGSIRPEPSGRGGFGYDPLFFVATIGRTFGEVDAPTKHALSHRGQAFRALRNALAG